MKKALVLVGLLLLASVSALGVGLTHANYQTWFQNSSAVCYFGITNTGLVDLYNGARFDNVSSATTLTITETNISLVGATSVTGAFSATSITGYSIGTDVQAYDADLAALAGVTTAANAIPYFTGSHTAGVISSSADMVSLLGSANYATARTNLGLAIGTNVQAYDADLTTWAGITPSANVQSFSACADYAAMKTLLALTIGTNVQAYDADLTTWAGVTPSANGQSLVSAADYSAMRTALSLVPGTNVQAYSADLGTVATAAGTATNEGVLMCTTFKLDYTQTASQTVGVIPASAYVTKVEVAVTTLFNGGGTDTLDIGISGAAADAYANNLDLATAGYITAGVDFSALGSVGGADRAITCLYVDQNSNASAGSALVNVYWRMGTIGD